MGNRRPPAPAALLCALVMFTTGTGCGEDSPTFQDARPIDAGLDGQEIDADPADPRPGNVTGLAATPTGIELALAWQNPTDADLDGILVVASADGPVTFTPVDGTTYAVAQIVATDEAVVNVAVATALANIPTIPGLGVHFAAWARDAAGQYSAVPATTRGVNNALGTQTGTIQVFQDGTVTVTQQPRSFVLSGTATYDDPNDAMTVQLTVENQAMRVVFNLKGLVDTASQGTVTNAPFPATGGLPMAYYGPEAAAIGGQVTRQLDLTGIDGTVDPVVLTMHFVDAPSLLLSMSGDAAQSVDAAASNQFASVSMPSQSCGKAESRGGALSPDGRFLFTGTKSNPTVTRIDLTTMSLTASASLSTTNGLGGVSDVAMSADGHRLYAVLQDGYHARGGIGRNCGGGELLRAPRERSGHMALDRVFGGAPSGTVRLIELDPETLEEMRRVDLRINSVFGAVALLDGNRAAVATRNGEVAIVNLATLTLIDADLGTPGVQPLDLGGELHERIVASHDGASFSVAVSTDTGFRVDTIDSATLAVTSVDVPDADDTRQRVVGLHRTADGTIYMLYRYASKGPAGGALVTIDGAQVSSRMPPGNGVNGLAFSTDETRYYVMYNGEARVFDRATHAEIDTDGDASNGVTPLPIDNFSPPHGLATFTPF